MATQVCNFIEKVEQQAMALPGGRFDVIVGCSFGGWIASILQERRPDLFGAAILLAPAIDNYQRNYEGIPTDQWTKPLQFVEEVHALPARPTIKVPTKLVHGMLDCDDGGSALWRVKEWAAENEFQGCYFPDGVDHSLQAWLDLESDTICNSTPSLSELLGWALCAASVPVHLKSPQCELSGSIQLLSTEVGESESDVLCF